MRRHRMYYNLAIIRAHQLFKESVRLLGEWMKVRGRLMVLYSESSTPCWDRKLFHRCVLAQAEVHLPGEVCRGYVDAIYERALGKKSTLIVRLRSVSREKDFVPLYQSFEEREFQFRQYGQPIVISEDGWDCVWFGFENGYTVIYFSRPQAQMPHM